MVGMTGQIQNAECRMRKHSAIGRWSLVFGLWSFLLLAFSAFAQTVAPGPRIVNQGGAIIFQGGPGAQPQLDPQTAAMMQQIGVDQNATATVEFDPPVISLGQRSTYRVTVTATTEGVSLPDDPPAPAGLTLTLVGRGFTYAGGGLGMQPRTSFNYRASVTAAGTYVMPSFTGSANGKPLKIPEARLTVLPPGTPGAQAGTARLLIELPQTEFYIGQAISVRLVLLDPGDNSVQGISQPQMSGDAFLAENFTLRYRREMRLLGGRNVAASLCEVFAYPLKAGQLPLSATAFAHLCRLTANPAMPQTVESVLVDTDPVSVTVKHLPKEGELPGFTGGIGVFQLEPAKLSTNVLRAGEPLTFTVTVKGEGNLTRLVAPKLDHPRGWTAYTPSADASGAVQIQLRGSVLFTYTLIPLSDRVQSTPAIPFSYFDPNKKSYVDLTVPPVPVKVLPPPGGLLPPADTAKTSTPSIDDPDRPAGGNELVLTGLAEAPGPSAPTLAPLQQRPWFLALQLVPAAALGGLWLRERRRRYLAQHPDVVLKARARRGLRRQLRLARRAATVRDAGGFVTSTINALREACAPRAAANPAALVCADVLEALEPSERDGEPGRLVKALFSAADAQRFVDRAPDGAALLALQPQIEGLLEKWRARL